MGKPSGEVLRRGLLTEWKLIILGSSFVDLIVQGLLLSASSGRSLIEEKGWL